MRHGNHTRQSKFYRLIEELCHLRLFDTGSTISFCTGSLIRQLGGHGKQLRITLNTMGELYLMNTTAVNGLQVYDLEDTRVYTKDKMPACDS